MSFLPHPFQVAFAVLSESMRKQQQKVIEYLQLENQILREKLGSKRVLLSDYQRRRLAVSGKALGRQQLGKISTIAQADTILRWHRELIEVQLNTVVSQTGRPRTDQNFAELVLRMARENASWGYKRIEGALHNLGYPICSSTVANILKQHGIPPAPLRKQQLSWTTFLRAHLDVFEGINLRVITLWLGELVSHIMGRDCPGKTTPCPADCENTDDAPRLTTVSLPIVRELETATHLTRAPPTASVGLPSNLQRDTRYAA